MIFLKILTTFYYYVTYRHQYHILTIIRNTKLVHARWSGLRHTPGPVLTFSGVSGKTSNEASTKACSKNCVGHVPRLALRHISGSGLINAVGTPQRHASGMVLASKVGHH